MSAATSLQSGKRHIPGYYFDKDKNKWFKLAHPASGGEHTASSVIKRRRTENSNKEEQHVARLRLTRDINVANYLLDRTCGKGSIPSIIKARSLTLQETQAFTLGGRPSKIAIDQENRHLYIASSRFLGVHDIDDPHARDRPLHQQIRSMHPIAPFRSEVSSLTWDASHGMLIATTTGDAERPAEFLIRKGAWAGPAVCRTFKGSLWCSAASPGKASYVAGGSQIIILDPEV